MRNLRLILAFILISILVSCAVSEKQSISEPSSQQPVLQETKPEAAAGQADSIEAEHAEEPLLKRAPAAAPSADEDDDMLRLD